MKKILIQANNLDTVIDVFMYIYLHPGCKKQDIADYCGFSFRQVDYYTNACKYLDLLNDDWSKTSLAIDIFTNHSAEITDKVYERIINDKVFGKMYNYLILNQEEYPTVYAKELAKEHFPGYSDAVYKRRSDIIIKWCIKIISYYRNK